MAEYLVLNKLVVHLAMRDDLCRRLMAIPGVGPVTALSFTSAIDDPARFRRSRDVAAYFGLTSKRWQSGTSIDVPGRISKAGDADVRRALYEAASALLTRFKGNDTIKACGLGLPRTKCHAKARIAVARKLAVVMHAMWRDGTFYVGEGRMISEKIVYPREPNCLSATPHISRKNDVQTITCRASRDIAFILPYPALFCLSPSVSSQKMP